MSEEMRDMGPETSGDGSTDTEGTMPSESGSTESGSADAEQGYEKASFAVLLALVPLLVFTFFGQAGLF